MRKQLMVALGVASALGGGYFWQSGEAAAANVANRTSLVVAGTLNADTECLPAAGALTQPRFAGAPEAMAPAAGVAVRTVAGAVGCGGPISLALAGGADGGVGCVDVIADAETVELTAPTDCAAVLVGAGWLETAAATIGIPTDELLVALDAETSIADQAAAHGVSRQALIDALVAAETTHLDQAVADGAISAADAERMAAELPTLIATFVDTADGLMASTPLDCVMQAESEPDTTGPHSCSVAFGMGTSAEFGFTQCLDLAGQEPGHTTGAPATCVSLTAGADWTEVAAEAIGSTPEELMAGVAAGTSIADQAAAHGVAVQPLIDALVAAETAHLDEAVADGELSAEEAAALAAGLPAMLDDFVHLTFAAAIGAPPALVPGTMACVSVIKDASGATEVQSNDCPELRQIQR